MKKVSSVDEYIENNETYREGLDILRKLILSTELEEVVKWNSPVYELNRKKVLSFGAFKHHFGIWFFNGVFLKDEKDLLEQAQEKTKGLRSIKFTSANQIDEPIILSYIKEAIQNQRLGKEIKPEKKGKNLAMPKLLGDALKQNPSYHESFKNLTPYKQREYAEYIDTAKREETKLSRIKKILPMIEKGIGLNDKYKNC